MSKIYIVSYNSWLKMNIVIYWVKGRVPLPNVCFMLPLRLKDRYTLIEQSAQ